MSTIQLLAEKGISINGQIPSDGQVKTTCPRCSHKRTKQDEECLSVNIEKGAWRCWHCGWSGQLKGFASGIQAEPPKERNSQKECPFKTDSLKLTKEVVAWFEKRGISEATLLGNGIKGAMMPFDRKDPAKRTMAAVFPYYKGGTMVNAQYRNLENKDFRMTKGCEPCFYGLQHLFEDERLATKRIFITEGQVDKLSLYECGYKYAISVPNGSQFEAEGEQPKNPELKYLEDPDVQAIFKYADEIVLVTDSDYQGRRLRDALAQRFGVEKCLTVEYPKDCKDINDVLVNHGEEMVHKVMTNLIPIVRGIITVEDMTDALMKLHTTGDEAGFSTGWDNMDEIYTVKPPYVTLVTGVPEIGKSTFLDNLVNNLAELHGMKGAFFSPETKPQEYHLKRLIEIHSQTPFGLPDWSDRITKDKLMESVEFAREHYSWIKPEIKTKEKIFEAAKAEVLRRGIKWLVIDPYSAIRRPSNRSEVDFIQELLSDTNDFAEANDVSVFFVAHPTKLQGTVNRDREVQDYPLVTPYDVKGAGDWYNSVDICLSLWRSRQQKNMPIEVHVLKSKLWHIAKSGEFRMLAFDRLINKYNPYTGSRDVPVDFDESAPIEENFEAENLNVISRRAGFKVYGSLDEHVKAIEDQHHEINIDDFE